MGNRIEEVKKILGEYIDYETWLSEKSATGGWKGDAAERVCQLFPQPLEELSLEDADELYKFYILGLTKKEKQLFNPYPLFDTTPKSPTELATRIKSWQKEDDWAVTLLKQGKKIVGMAILKRCSTIYPVTGVAVRKDCRNRGFATLLLQDVNNRAKALGLKRVYTSISPNNKASLRTHQKCGYRPTGQAGPHPGDIEMVWENRIDDKELREKAQKLKGMIKGITAMSVDRDKWAEMFEIIDQILALLPDVEKAQEQKIPQEVIEAIEDAKILGAKWERERMGDRKIGEVLEQLKNRILLSQACLADEIHDMGGEKKVPHLAKKQKLWGITVARIVKLSAQIEKDWQALKGGE